MSVRAVVCFKFGLRVHANSNCDFANVRLT